MNQNVYGVGHDTESYSPGLTVFCPVVVDADKRCRIPPARVQLFHVENSWHEYSTLFSSVPFSS